MRSNNTPIKLNVICDKIIDATNFYIRDNEYAGLCDLLRIIKKKNEHYSFIEIHSVEGIDWDKTIPVMQKLLSKLEELDIVQQLHQWHYQQNNIVGRIPELTLLANDLLRYYDVILGNYVL